MWSFHSVFALIFATSFLLWFRIDSQTASISFQSEKNIYVSALNMQLLDDLLITFFVCYHVNLVNELYVS